MSGFTEYTEYDATGLAELVANKEVTSAELTETAIERIERINPRLNAVVYKLYDRARKQATGDLPDGPFRGVPFLIKDLLSALSGEPMQCGSRMYAGYRPRKNSELVNRYLATGVVIVGKTNTPELGLLPTTEPAALGAARNPWDVTRTTGGSSGGTGAAVAARIVPMGGGGDGGGSIRIPSSCCGIFGLKPTRGRTPVGPYETENWHGFAQEHVLTRSVRDSAAMLDAVSGPYLGDVHYLDKPTERFIDQVGKAPGKLRIAYSSQPILPGKVSQEAVAAVDDAVGLLRQLGHEVIPAAPAIDGHAFARSFLVVISCQTAAGIRTAEKRMGRKASSEDFELKTWLTARMGEAFSGGDYVEAIGNVQAMSAEVLRFCYDYDLVLNPTVAEAPPKLGFLEPKGVQAIAEQVMGRLPIARLVKNTPLIDQAAAEVYAFIPWTPVYNATGQPSMSVPLKWTDDGLPTGVMFTGKLGDEATLYRLAAQLEQARPWKDRRPPVS